MFKIIPLYFILALFIGILILYIISPEPYIIVKNPDPNDELSDKYIDENNVCYRYRRQKVSCINNN